jgi:hypothetical protein
MAGRPRGRPAGRNLLLLGFEPRTHRTPISNNPNASAVRSSVERPVRARVPVDAAARGDRRFVRDVSTPSTSMGRSASMARAGPSTSADAPRMSCSPLGSTTTTVVVVVAGGSGTGAGSGAETEAMVTVTSSTCWASASGPASGGDGGVGGTSNCGLGSGGINACFS